MPKGLNEGNGLAPSANMSDSESQDRGQYIVVARRYRPQGFEDLVGQGMVSQALRNAIESDRVGHAYLFTGARGVGKTSTARIISKALNCVEGPTETPCHKCDICESIASGDDVDVLEIDGASNRGIDEIRQLRSNVSVRPSRSRYKIYIIDEVHMLTKEAFNALLKTLEEPPEHVKFIFCTTDPEKIPITVLSRCQRFDFAPVGADEIVTRLQFIVKSEGSEADEEALKLLARKAAGSVRDSQSLLEQLLSFTSGRITVEAVHDMLGTADSSRLYGLASALANRDAAGALTELNSAIGQGVDAGQLTEQLLGCVRDLLVMSVGGTKELLLHASESDAKQLNDIASSWGTSNLLATAQILDQALARMRVVTYSRVLLETALIRIAHLENLQELSDLIAQVQSGSSATVVKKKVNDSPPKAPTAEANVNASHAADTANSGVAATPNAGGSDQAKPSQIKADDSTAKFRVDAGHPASRPEEVKQPVATPTKNGSKPATPVDAPDADSAGKLDHVENLDRGTSNHPEPSRQTPPPPKKPTVDGASKPTPETVLAGATPADDESSADSPGKKIWQTAISQFEGMSADCAGDFSDVANIAPNRLVVTFPARYTSSKSFCERPERHGEMEKIVSKIAGKKLKLEFSVRTDAAHEAPPRPMVSARQLEREVVQRDYVRRATELFSAEVVGVVMPRRNDD